VGHSYQPSSGLVYSTTDGGVNWTPITGFEQADLKEVFFIDAQTGFVTGMQDGLGVIFKTTDGGQSWAETEIQADLPSPVNDIHFPTADIGYAATRGAVLKSEDQGDNWYIVAQVDIDDPAVFPFSIIEAIYFSDENHGIFGGWYSAALCTSTDGGQSWNAYDGLTIEIFSIDFPTASVGYAFGTNVNSYLKTTDGGANWELLDFPPSLPSGGSYYGAHFAAEDIGLIVGTSGLILKMGEFPVSTNEPGNSTNSSLIFP
ncbi:MAG: hypothetical protein KDC44_17670, partial [Phaeodactylibacter sp.]|nr:hypothetical protein [Phaeodactylibacter sp.]